MGRGLGGRCLLCLHGTWEKDEGEQKAEGA